MSHSRQTEHYDLPLYNGTDIINPLTDFNDANEAIDRAIYNANQSASSANTKADSAVAAVADYDERITAAENKADSALTKNSDTEKMIANEFDPLKDGGYAIGDSVTYNDKLYTFINPHTGAWDAGDVINQPITDAVKSTIAEGKAEIQQETQEAMAEIAAQTQKVTATQKMIAEPFDPNGEYAKGKCVTYADKLYEFNVAHRGAWTGDDVTEISATQLCEYLESDISNLDSSVDEIRDTTTRLSNTTSELSGSVDQLRNTVNGLTTLTAWTTLNAAYNAKYRKCGRVVEISVYGNSSPSTGASYDLLGTLPAEYRPSDQVACALARGWNHVSGEDVIVYLEVNTNGNVHFVAPSGTRGFGTIMYLV